MTIFSIVNIIFVLDLKLRSLMNMDVFHGVFSLAGKSERKGKNG